MLSAVLRGHYAYYGLSGNSRAATQAVGQTADPQKDAAIGIVAWATHGALQPTVSDFATLRFAASITVTGLRLWPLEEPTVTSTDGRRLAVFFPP